jgi:peptide/nickel transport system substrate-binding protein
VLELIRDSWRRIGIRSFAKPSQLTPFRRRVFSGETLMSVDKGIENGLATAAMSPAEFAPTSQQQLEGRNGVNIMRQRGWREKLQIYRPQSG